MDLCLVKNQHGKCNLAINSLWPGDAIDVVSWPYGDIDLGQHRSGNGLVPSGTKPLPEPMLTYRQWGVMALTNSQALTNFTGSQFLK